MDTYLKIRVKGELGEVDIEFDKRLFWDNQMGKDMLGKDKFNYALDGVIKVYQGLAPQLDEEIKS